MAVTLDRSWKEEITTDLTTTQNVNGTATSFAWGQLNGSYALKSQAGMLTNPFAGSDAAYAKAIDTGFSRDYYYSVVPTGGSIKMHAADFGYVTTLSGGDLVGGDKVDDGIAYDPKRNVFYTSSSLDTPKIHRWIVGDNGQDWQYDREMLLYGAGTIYACPGGIATDSEYLFCLAADGKIHRYLFTNTDMIEQRGFIDLGTEAASMGIEWINGVLYTGGTGDSSTRLTAVNTSNWPAGMLSEWSGYEPVAQVTTPAAGSIRTLVADGRNLNVLSSSGTAAYQYPLFMDSLLEAHVYSEATGRSSRPYQLGGHIDMFDGTGSLDTTRWQVPFGVWNRSNGVMLQSATAASTYELFSRTEVGSDIGENYVVEVDVLGSPGVNSLGIVFLRNGNNNFLRFKISPQTSPENLPMAGITTFSGTFPQYQRLDRGTDAYHYKPDTWHNLRLVVHRNNAMGYVDGVLVARVELIQRVYETGYVGIFCNGGPARFDNFRVGELYDEDHAEDGTAKDRANPNAPTLVSGPPTSPPPPVAEDWVNLDSVTLEWNRPDSNATTYFFAKTAFDAAHNRENAIVNGTFEYPIKGEWVESTNCTSGSCGYREESSSSNDLPGTYWHGELASDATTIHEVLGQDLPSLDGTGISVKAEFDYYCSFYQRQAVGIQALQPRQWPTGRPAKCNSAYGRWFQFRCQCFGTSVDQLYGRSKRKNGGLLRCIQR